AQVAGSGTAGGGVVKLITAVAGPRAASQPVPPKCRIREPFTMLRSSSVSPLTPAVMESTNAPGNASDGAKVMSCSGLVPRNKLPLAREITNVVPVKSKVSNDPPLVNAV